MLREIKASEISNEQLVKLIDDMLRFSANTLNGRVQLVKLWENAKPTGSFAEQTITLDLTDCPFVMVQSTPQNSLTLMRKDPENATYAIGAGYPTGGIWTYYRSAMVSDTGIKFRTAYHIDYQGKTASDNNSMIPKVVYGLKVNGGGV